MSSPPYLQSIRGVLADSATEVARKHVYEQIAAAYPVVVGDVVRISPEAATEWAGRLGKVQSIGWSYIAVEVSLPGDVFETDLETHKIYPTLIYGREWIQPA